MIRGQNDSAESCRKSIRIENLITCAAFYSRKQIPVLEGFLSNHLTLVFVSDAEVHSISYTNKALVFWIVVIEFDSAWIARIADRRMDHNLSLFIPIFPLSYCTFVVCSAFTLSCFLCAIKSSGLQMFIRSLIKSDIAQPGPNTAKKCTCVIHRTWAVWKRRRESLVWNCTYLLLGSWLLSVRAEIVIYLGLICCFFIIPFKNVSWFYNTTSLWNGKFKYLTWKRKVYDKSFNVSSFLILYFNETIKTKWMNLHVVLFLPRIYRFDQLLSLKCSATNLHEIQVFITQK